MNLSKITVFLLVLGLAFPALAAHNVTTLQELEQDVKNNIAISNDPYLPDTVLDDFINLACRDVASYNLIEKLDTVVVTAGDNQYDLNEDFLEATAIYPCSVTAARGLDRIEFKDWGKIAAATQLTTMKYYAIQHEFVANSSGGIISAAQLWVYPAHSGVDDTLLVHYTAEADELIDDADTCNIPYVYRQLVVFYATAMAFGRAQEYDRMNLWFSLYDQMLNKKLLFRKYGVDYLVMPKQITR